MKTIRMLLTGVVVMMLAFTSAPPAHSSLVGGPSTANGFTQMFADKNDLIWSGGDQMTSFQLNGFVYWLSGDPILSDGVNPDGSYPAGSTMVSSRILLQSGGQLSNAIAHAGSGPLGNGVPDPANKTETNQSRYWVQGMFAANGNVYVLAQRVERDPMALDPSLAFRFKGVEIARYSQNPVSGRLTFRKMLATPSTGVEGGRGPMHIQWAADAVVHEGYVYIYGYTLANEGNPFVGHFSYVARVPESKVENQFDWRFYAKSSNTWKTRLEDLDQDLGYQRDALTYGQISSVRLVGTKFVLVHKPWNGYGSAVQATTSSTPYGPAWSPEVTIFSSPAGTTPGGQNYWTYSPQIHPEQTLASGKTLVSIAWNGRTLADTMADADLYKPRFYEIQF